jgi:hypothetical protein
MLTKYAKEKLNVGNFKFDTKGLHKKTNLTLTDDDVAHFQRLINPSHFSCIQSWRKASAFDPPSIPKIFIHFFLCCFLFTKKNNLQEIGNFIVLLFI